MMFCLLAEEDFTVEVKEPIVEIEGIEFDWFVVGEEKQVKEETSASASSTVQTDSSGTTILLNADSSVQ